MLSETEKGKQVRQWYLEVEKEWRQLKQQAVSIKPSGLVWYDRLKLFKEQNAHKIPVGYFSIFHETIDLISEFERVGYIIPDNQVPDISIGKRWGKYLRDNQIATDVINYVHTYPDGREVTCLAYHENHLPLFRKWFREQYKPTGLPEYARYRKDSDFTGAVYKLLGYLPPSSSTKSLPPKD